MHLIEMSNLPPLYFLIIKIARDMCLSSIKSSQNQSHVPSYIAKIVWI